MGRPWIRLLPQLLTRLNPPVITTWASYHSQFILTYLRGAILRDQRQTSGAFTLLTCRSGSYPGVRIWSHITLGSLLSPSNSQQTNAELQSRRFRRRYLTARRSGYTADGLCI